MMMIKKVAVAQVEVLFQLLFGGGGGRKGAEENYKISKK
jgi:hypothetical protein